MNVKRPQKISLIARPKDKFGISVSEGYLLYSSLLDAIRESSLDISRHIHDSPISSISIGTLDGKFGKSIRQGHKTLDPSEMYVLDIAITDPNETEIFQAIVAPLIHEERDLNLEKGNLRIEEASSTTASFEELLKKAKSFQDPCIDFRFKR